MPKILLYVCCAPDATQSAEVLRAEGYEVISFFYNPNVHPAGEYKKRSEAMLKLGKEMCMETILGEYDFKNWFASMKPRAKDIEGGEACFECFRIRLDRAAAETKKLNLPLFTSTLTISPHKDADKINAIGAAVALKYGVNYLPSNFKKKDGFKKSVELSKKYDLYRQHYCGCSWSLIERRKNP